jgi:hypothetical protein
MAMAPPMSLAALRVLPPPRSMAPLAILLARVRQYAASHRSSAALLVSFTWRIAALISSIP